MPQDGLQQRSRMQLRSDCERGNEQNGLSVLLAGGSCGAGGDRSAGGGLLQGPSEEIDEQVAKDASLNSG